MYSFLHIKQHAHIFLRVFVLSSQFFILDAADDTLTSQYYHINTHKDLEGCRAIEPSTLWKEIWEQYKYLLKTSYPFSPLNKKAHRILGAAWESIPFCNWPTTQLELYIRETLNLSAKISLQEERNLTLTTTKEGYGGAQVKLVKDEQGQIIAAIKLFERKNSNTHPIEGIREILNCQIALSLNPDEREFKMARILAIGKHPCEHIEDSCISVTFEGAQGGHFYEVLKQGMAKEGDSNCIEDALKAGAQYLGKFHAHACKVVSTDINKENPQNSHQSYESFKEVPSRIYYEYFVPYHLTNYQYFLNKLITKKDIEKVLTDHKTFTYKDLIKNLIKVGNRFAAQNFINSEGMSRGRSTWAEKNDLRLTINHGDMHGANVFYNPHLLLLDENEIHKRITLIDYNSMNETRECIGDPAYDVGRFLGSLWAWMIIEGYGSQEHYQKTREWEKLFIKTYLHHNSFSTKQGRLNFKYNVNFYKISLYKYHLAEYTDNKAIQENLLEWIYKQTIKALGIKKNSHKVGNRYAINIPPIPLHSLDEKLINATLNEAKVASISLIYGLYHYHFRDEEFCSPRVRRVPALSFRYFHDRLGSFLSAVKITSGYFIFKKKFVDRLNSIKIYESVNQRYMAS